MCADVAPDNTVAAGSPLEVVGRCHYVIAAFPLAVFAVHGHELVAGLHCFAGVFETGYLVTAQKMVGQSPGAQSVGCHSYCLVGVVAGELVEGFV